MWRCHVIAAANRGELRDDIALPVGRGERDHARIDLEFIVGDARR
jgi:hypothetical protein